MLQQDIELVIKVLGSPFSVDVILFAFFKHINIKSCFIKIKLIELFKTAFN